DRAEHREVVANGRRAVVGRHPQQRQLEVRTPPLAAPHAHEAPHREVDERGRNRALRLAEQLRARDEAEPCGRLVLGNDDASGTREHPPSLGITRQRLAQTASASPASPDADAAPTPAGSSRPGWRPVVNTNSPSTRSTCTWSPASRRPCRISSESLSSISCCTARR